MNSKMEITGTSSRKAYTVKSKSEYGNILTYRHDDTRQR